MSWSNYAFNSKLPSKKAKLPSKCKYMWIRPLITFSQNLCHRSLLSMPSFTILSHNRLWKGFCPYVLGYMSSFWPWWQSLFQFVYQVQRPSVSSINIQSRYFRPDKPLSCQDIFPNIYPAQIFNWARYFTHIYISGEDEYLDQT